SWPTAPRARTSSRTTQAWNRTTSARASRTARGWPAATSRWLESQAGREPGIRGARLCHDALVTEPAATRACEAGVDDGKCQLRPPSREALMPTAPRDDTDVEQLDVLIVGAGISGI